MISNMLLNYLAWTFEILISMMIAFDQVVTILNPFNRTKYLDYLFWLLKVAVVADILLLVIETCMSLNHMTDVGLRLSIHEYIQPDLFVIFGICAMVNMLTFLITLTAYLTSKKSTRRFNKEVRNTVLKKQITYFGIIVLIESEYLVLFVIFVTKSYIGQY